MSNIIMFASNRPFKEVLLPPDFEIHIDINHGTVTVDDGGRDDGFEIFPYGGEPEIETDMEYFAELRWTYTPGRAERVIEYLREHLKTTDEIELWHTWVDNDFDHRIREREIPIDELSADKLREIDQIHVWKEPVTDYCYVITGPKGSGL